MSFLLPFSVEVAQKSNVVFLLVDDFGEGAIHFGANESLESPNMDALYNEGIFTLKNIIRV